MKLLKTKMNKEIAQEILRWQYEPPYDFYNNKSSDSEMAELMNETYFAVLNKKQETTGFFCTGESAQVPSGNSYKAYEEDCIDVGLGMNPALVGKGKGMEFGLFVLYSIEETYQKLPVRLTVALFNKRALHLYKKLGFVLDKRFSSDTVEFITMVKKY